MADQWYFSENGSSNGPLSLEELKQKIEQGEISPEALFWKEGMAEWASAHVALADVFPAAATSSPSPAANVTPEQEANPYAPPVANVGVEQEIIQGMVEPRPHLDFGFCFSQGWKHAIKNLGMILLLGLVYFGIIIVVSMIIGFLNQIVTLAFAGAGASFSGGDPMEQAISSGEISTIAAAMGSQFFFQFIQTSIQLFFTLGLIRVGLNVLTGRELEIGELFSQGKHYVKSLLATLLVYVMIIPVLLISLIPLGVWAYANQAIFQNPQNIGGAEITAIIGLFLLAMIPYGLFMVRLMFYNEAIVDQGLGAVDSVKYSFRLTQKNTLLLTLFFIIIGFINLASFLVCIGWIVALPFTWLARLVAFRYLQRGPDEVHNVMLIRQD